MKNKKKKIKFAVEMAMRKHYEESGFTNTANKVKADVMKAIDKIFQPC